MQTITLDEFLRSFKLNMDSPHSLLLGAGASVESGVQSANDCIWDWKKEIFLSQNQSLLEYYSNTRADNVRRNIQRWIDDQGIFPTENSNDEYAFFAEKAYPIEDNRRKYFQKLAVSAIPSLGYHIISFMAELGVFKSVWTTNFDGLMEKCAHQYKLSPISITAETVSRFYREQSNGELLTIALHGDYKYGKLKNTTAELDSQNDELIKALKYELTNRDLIVIGYSGRDISLMNALKKAYAIRGAGKLFWCGYGKNANDSVSDLINYVNQFGRNAYYIPTNGFDETLYSIARYCYCDNKTRLQDIEKIKVQLAKIDTIRKSDFTSFKVEAPNKVIDTNLYPIKLPQSCYQFEIRFNAGEKAWDYCKTLYKKGIMAIPYKGIIYAWGEKSKIISICNDKLKSDISFSPLTKETIQEIAVFKELILKTVVCILASRKGLAYSKSKIWDKKQSIKKVIGKKEIIAYKGVSLSLLIDDSFYYISFSPTYSYDETCILSLEEKKEFAAHFSNIVNGNSPNNNIKNYVNSWVKNLIENHPIESYFPIESSERSFIFKVGQNSAHLKSISDSAVKQLNLPSTIPDRRLVFNGIECRDPQLVFYNMQRKCLSKDFHPMRGLTQFAPIDVPINIKSVKSAISLGVICPLTHNNEFYKFLIKLNAKCKVEFNTDYVIDYPGFYNAFKTNVQIPYIGDTNWLDISANNTMTIREFGENLARKLDQMSARAVDVTLIYIPKEYEYYTSYSDGNENFDLHDYIKAYAAQKQIATQFVREKTLESNLLCQIMWALSLAIYVKSNRIPWLVSNSQNDTAFAGVGYSVKKNSQGSNVVIGCSHVYSSDGQGLKYKLSKITDVTIDNKLNPFLSENEAYKLGLNIKELFYNSFSEMPKRVVIHKRTPFKREEVKGLIESLSSAGIEDIELLEISYEDNIKCFAYNKDMTKADSFPVKRGLCFPLNRNTMLLYTHGIAPSVISEYRSYIQGGKSIPMPLKIVNHYGSSSMQKIASEVLGLSKMNWNSFGLYTKLPCTIESSNEIARIGWLLSQYEGALYEYRFFM